MPTINTVEVPTALNKMIKEMGVLTLPLTVPQTLLKQILAVSFNTSCLQVLAGESGEYPPTSTQTRKRWALNELWLMSWSSLEKAFYSPPLPPLHKDYHIQENLKISMQTLLVYAYLCPKWAHSVLYFPEFILAAEGNPISFCLPSSVS